MGVGLVVEGRCGGGDFWTSRAQVEPQSHGLVFQTHRLSAPPRMKKNNNTLLNQRHLPPEAQPVALLSGEDNTADERTHREHIYPGTGPGNCIPMDLLEKKKPAEHILHVNTQN